MKKVLMLLLIVSIFATGLMPSYVLAEMGEEERKELTEEQANAINMLNYLRFLTQEIRASSNSRLFLEEAYSSLTNNTNPNAVDSQTLDEVLSLLDTLEEYRMVAVKRDRLKYIYEQKQAQAVHEAIPNPIGLFSVVRSFNAPKMAISLLYMAVDSVSSYSSATSNAEMEYLQDGWELDDKEAKALHNSRKDLYSYMVNMVNIFNLDGSLSLNEDSVDDFVSWKNNDNLSRKVQFFESNKNTYKAFGPYWLTLAECYYQMGDFQNCLDSIGEYEKLNVKIFRKDYEYAKTLPLIIAALKEHVEKEEYISKADSYCVKILENTNDSYWELRYFAAETYYDLYSETEKKEYIEKAYDTLLNNINYLVDEQEKLNKQYLDEVKEEDVPDGATKQQKAEIKDYNKMIKNQREREVAPVYEPLLINCDLLFTIADELQIEDSEKARILSILRGNNDCIFLPEPIDNLFTFESTNEIVSEDIEIEYDGDELTIPAKYVTDITQIKVYVDDEESTVFDDWVIDEVDRVDEHDFESFLVTFESEAADDYSFTGEEKVSIEITVWDNSTIPLITAEYQAHREKALDVLETWGWLDDVSSFTDDIEFERIEQ